MENSGHIILFGTGHLAFQVARRLRDRNLPFVHIGSEDFKANDRLLHKSAIEQSRERLQKAHASTARAIYVLDDEDRYNIQFALVSMSLTSTTPILVSLLNAEIAAQLRASRPEIIVRNPAVAATKIFVDSLHAPVTRRIRHQPAPEVRPPSRWLLELRGHPWLYGSAIAFLILLGIGTVVLHFTEHLSWVDAFYFAGTMMTTTGFGDISLRNSLSMVKVFGVGLMVSSVVLASLTFSFVADRLFKRRTEISLGRRKHHLRGHVIVCGLGRVGYQVVSELLRRNEEVLVIEKDPDDRFLQIVRAQGAKTSVGDASISSVLANCGLDTACGLFSLINDDLKNLEIGLAARALRPDLRLILRVFDREIAEQVRDALDIHFALSSSAIAADEFVELLGIDAPEGSAVNNR